MKKLITASVIAAALGWVIDPAAAQTRRGRSAQDAADAHAAGESSISDMELGEEEQGLASDAGAYSYDANGYGYNQGYDASYAVGQGGYGAYGLDAYQTSLYQEQDAAAAGEAEAAGEADHAGHSGGGCSSCGDSGCDDCCIPFWEHRTSIFGDFLYLDARGVDMAYAQPRNGVDLLTSVPAGRVGVANPDFQSGFRAGLNLALDRCSSIGGSYTLFQSSTFDTFNINAPLVIHSLVTHRGTASAASDSLSANANYDIDFELIDLWYKRLWRGGRNYSINYLVGLRYGKLEQDLTARQPISPGTTTVLTDIDFEGLGPRFGLEGERRLKRFPLFAYARGYSSFLAGHFDSNYDQSNTFAQRQVFTSWRDDRIVPVLEYELGVGWENCKGNLRLSTGYYMSAWFNSVTTNEWVQAVQTSNFVDVGDTNTFDGFTARVELRR